MNSAGTEESALGEIVVRIMEPEDEKAADEVWATALETLRETYRTTPGFLDGWTAPSEITRVVALLDGRVVGTIKYYTEDDRLHIMCFGIHSDFRGQGVGRRMLEFLSGIARSRGFRCISVYTIGETGNTPIYQRLGFEVISEEPAKWAESDKYGNLTDVYFEKSL